MATVYMQDYDSPVGKLVLLSTEKGLCYVQLGQQSVGGLSRFINKHFAQAEIKTGGKHNQEAVKQLKGYFSGKLKKFSIPLDLVSEGFYRRVQLKVKSIPFGKTMTYGEIADELGSPGAARAVGGANGANPIPIIIPCHRVLSSTGLGGYGGGLEMKQKLLELEGVLNKDLFA